MMSAPVVTVKNHSSRDLFVDGDPNWDDQRLKLSGKVLGEVHTLAKGATIQLSVDWNAKGDAQMMGVIFAEKKIYDHGVGFYQMTIGQDEEGRLDVTAPNPMNRPHVKYTVEAQTPWTMTLTFHDA